MITVEYQPFMKHPVVEQVRDVYGEMPAFRVARLFAWKEQKAGGVNMGPYKRPMSATGEVKNFQTPVSANTIISK